MNNITEERLKQILRYANERGNDMACRFFDIKLSTLERYERKARQLGLDIKKKYESPKVLLLDIETSSMEGEFWRMGKQTFYDHNLITKDWSILCWSAKWLYDSEIMGERVSGTEAIARKDKTVLSSLWNLLEEADILIAHNLSGFDERKIKTRFILNNFQPVSPYQTIDTLKCVRKEFGFTSNRLDYLAQRFGIGKKIRTDRELWTRCIRGDEKALDEMFVYNKHDVNLLEEVYLKLRPWIKSHPNIGLYYDDMGNRCPNCGSKNLELNGKYYTPCGKYNSIRCKDCGAYGRERYSLVGKDKRKSLLRSNAR